MVLTLKNDPRCEGFKVAGTFLKRNDDSRYVVATLYRGRLVVSSRGIQYSSMETACKLEIPVGDKVFTVSVKNGRMFIR